MLVNSSILSIPPYISTSWKNILSLHIDNLQADAPLLVVTLTNNQTIEIPNLATSLLDLIFQTHALHLQQDTIASKQNEQKLPGSFGPLPAFSFSIGTPGKTKDLEGFSPFGGLMQHNPEEASAPDLPSEMLSKISSISKSMGLDKQLGFMPKAEPHCNCPYCQITRALNSEPEISDTAAKKVLEQEELIDDSDLAFKDWEIKDSGHDLYEVTHPLDPNEKYQVFLGTPIGCTCGCKNCEHIKAVLNS
jgi:hypothetical protein